MMLVAQTAESSWWCCVSRATSAPLNDLVVLISDGSRHSGQRNRQGKTAESQGGGVEPRGKIARPLQTTTVRRRRETLGDGNVQSFLFHVRCLFFERCSGIGRGPAYRSRRTPPSVLCTDIVEPTLLSCAAVSITAMTLPHS